MKARGVRPGALVRFEGRLYVVVDRSPKPGSWWLQPKDGSKSFREAHGSHLESAHLK